MNLNAIYDKKANLFLIDINFLPDLSEDSDIQSFPIKDSGDMNAKLLD